MTLDIHSLICKATGAQSCFHIEDVQSLWSGYGMIMRYGLIGCDRDRVVIKHVKLPSEQNHPRGWNTNRSHLRKVKSYQVESVWYRDWSRACDNNCRVPASLSLESGDDEFLMVLEDLDASGFSIRKESVETDSMQVCLRWLAHFHATYMQQNPAGLWQVGTYWHLDTRPNELETLDDLKLKRAAAQIDHKLRTARYQTFVHGDAKLANFCFADEQHSDHAEQVAAVDFQYVGGGCGMKDVAYFIGSCLNETECERHAEKLLDYYFSELEHAMSMRRVNSSADKMEDKSAELEFASVEREWRGLFPVAWSDFHRFLKGWSSGHWKIHSYSERLANEVVASFLKN